MEYIASYVLFQGRHVKGPTWKS